MRVPLILTGLSLAAGLLAMAFECDGVSLSHCLTVSLSHAANQNVQVQRNSST
jgi:hypothetical protein